jgi:RHS repeat-associated protein
MEKVNEQYGEGNAYDFGARIYDPRIGRWLSIDPLAKKYPGESPYSFCGNSPIVYKDFDGKDYGVYINHVTKTIVVKATYYTVKGDVDSYNSAVLATQFWNDQSGKYQYKVGEGNDAIFYDILFELDVIAVDNIDQEINTDRAPFIEDSKKCTPDGSSNAFIVKPDADKVFDSNSKGHDNGKTFHGNTINVKESAKSGDTGPHEVGHTLGLLHFLSGLMTENSNHDLRSTQIDRFEVQEVLFYSLFPSQDAGQGKRYEQGEKPQNFDDGEVKRK